MHANEVIEISNSGHITMPPDLKSSNKNTYNKENKHNYNKGKMNKFILNGNEFRQEEQRGPLENQLFHDFIAFDSRTCALFYS